MSPRKYDNSRRRAAAAVTRERIVAATFEVHGEQGIAGARLEDIAARAGVSIGTLYRHFPTYESLVVACGELTFARTPMPDEDEARRQLDGVRPQRARVKRLVERVFGFYDETGDMLEVMRRDVRDLPFLAEPLGRIEAGVAAWVQVALEGRPDEERRLARALVDDRTWTALTAQGIEDPAAVVVELLGA